MMGGRDHQGPNKDRALSLGYGRVGLSPPMEELEKPPFVASWDSRELGSSPQPCCERLPFSGSRPPVA